MSETIDPDEIARFNKVADSWWDMSGPYKALHALNPTRIGYLRDQMCFHYGRDTNAASPLKGLRILDIGCGGGLVCEPMARLGAQVIGVDASEQNVGVAKAHAGSVGLDIDYRAGEAAGLIGREEPFDVVLALEVVEHVSNVSAFLGDCRALVKDGGGFGYSTLNKTLASLAVAKIGAEYVARLVPKGTHEWSKFIKPSTMAEHLKAATFEPWDSVGLVPDVFERAWRTAPIKAVNYIGWARAS